MNKIICLKTAFFNFNAPLPVTKEKTKHFRSYKVKVKRLCLCKGSHSQASEELSTSGKFSSLNSMTREGIMLAAKCTSYATLAMAQ